jgi:hypothetical protein
VTFLAPTLPRQTERSFQAQVVKLAELLGWRCYHTLRSEGSASGFPDLVLVRARHPKPRVIFAELKADRGRLTDDQTSLAPGAQGVRAGGLSVEAVLVVGRGKATQVRRPYATCAARCCLLALVPAPGTAEATSCYLARVTAYVKSEYGPYTADGTPIWTSEPIAASAPDLPFGTIVEIAGCRHVSRWPIAGMLGAAGQIDVAVSTRPTQAYSHHGLCGTVCVTPP